MLHVDVARGQVSCARHRRNDVTHVEMTLRQLEIGLEVVGVERIGGNDKDPQDTDSVVIRYRSERLVDIILGQPSSVRIRESNEK